MATATTQGKPAVFQILPGKDGAGKPIFAVLVKRTYDIRCGKMAIRASADRPLVKVDEYYDHGDPEWCTVKYETDLTPYKPATDVVVIGKAYAPAGQSTRQMDIAIEVANIRKVIRVTGERRCLYRQNKPPAFTDPQPFTEMEIRYERAYGGRDRKSMPPMLLAYPRNTLGTGFAIKNTHEVIDGLYLPNFEDPKDMLVPERVVLEDPINWNRQPLPQGLGWFHRTWYPRCSFVGSVPGFVKPEEPLREELLGLVPQNQVALARQFKLPSYDVRFNNGASLGLVLPYLRGDEMVRLIRLTPDGQLEFTLPADRPNIMLDIGLGENKLEVVLHTVCVRVEEMQVDLVWRGAHEYPGNDWLPEMKRMVAEVG